MPFEDVKSIGKAGTTLGRNYSTVQGWEDACPADLVAADTVWKGECYNDLGYTDNGEFLDSGTLSQVLFVSGVTTDGARFLWLTAAAGHSFQDHANVRTNPLRYDQSKGVGLRQSGQYGKVVWIHHPQWFVRITRLQLKADHAQSDSALYFAGPVADVRDCVLQQQSAGYVAYGGHTNTFRNCVFIASSGSNPAVSTLSSGSSFRTDFVGCTFIRPSDYTPAGIGVATPYGNGLRLISCAIFGFTSPTNAGEAASRNNATSAASGLPGTGNVHSVTYSQTTPFVDADKDSLDLRAVAGSALAGAGSLIWSWPTDISGAVRPVAPTIGHWEVAPGTATTLVVVASDDFNRTNGGLGANWVNQQHADTATYLEIVDGPTNGAVRGSNTQNQQSYWDAHAFNQDQYAQADITVGYHYLGLTVRASGAGASSNSYTWLATYGSLYKLAGSTYTEVQTGIFPAGWGTTIRLEATGSSPTTIRCYVDGVRANVDYVDSASPLTTGKPGLYASPSNTAQRIDDWVGGNIVAAGGGAITASLTQTLGAATLEATGTVAAGPVTADLTQILGAASVASMAEVAVTADLAQTLGVTTLTSDAASASVADLMQMLGVATLASTGSVAAAGERIADLTQTLGTAVLASAAAAAGVADLAQTLGAATLASTATATPVRVADLAQTLGVATLSATGTVVTLDPRTATLVQTLGAATLRATAGPVPGPVYARAQLVLLLNNVWTDVTADWLQSEPTTWKRGLGSPHPKEVVAGTGSLEAVLDNSEHNSLWQNTGQSGLGYYSPNSLNCRPGFHEGIFLRLVFHYREWSDTAGITAFTGKVRVISPEAGRYGSRRTRLVAEDAVSDLAENSIIAVTPQIGLTEEAVMRNVFNALPAASQPVSQTYDPSLDTLPYALDDAFEGGAAGLGCMERILSSVRGLGYIDGLGGWVYKNRLTRVLAAVDYQFTEQELLEIGVPSNLANVFNLVRITIHPKELSPPGLILWEHVGSLALDADPPEEETVEGTYRDPVQTDRKLGGAEFVLNPVGVFGAWDSVTTRTLGALIYTTNVNTTDYFFSSSSSSPGAMGVEPPTGTDVSRGMQITATCYATKVIFTVKNNTKAVFGGAGYPAHKVVLQVRGRGIFDNAPVVRSATTAQPYGLRPVELDWPYADNDDAAQEAAALIEASYRTLQDQVTHATFRANQSDALMRQALRREIGHSVAVSDVVALPGGADAYIQAIAGELQEGHVLKTTFHLAPRLPSDQAHADGVQCTDTMSITTVSPAQWTVGGGPAGPAAYTDQSQAS